MSSIQAVGIITSLNCNNKLQQLFQSTLMTTFYVYISKQRLYRVSDLNSSLFDLYTSLKDVFLVINVYLQEQFQRQCHYQLK